MADNNFENASAYHGAPTRVGRLILFFFGLPFVLGAVAFFLGAIFGDAKEWLALLMAGSAFLIVGLIVWAPAFPGVVNRLRRSNHPAVIWLVHNMSRIGVSLLVLIMGGAPLLMALGIIPAEKAAGTAPRWVGIVAGGVFLVAGMYVLLHRRIQQLEPRIGRQILGMFPLLIVTGMAAIADWIAFGPGERAFSVWGHTGLFGIQGSGDQLTGRIVFGISGVFLSAITLIGWRKYLSGRW